jgi:M6 family metalloprotease-like protein
VDRLFTTVGSGTGNLLDYFGAVSHGRLDLTGNRVFDWIDYGHSLDDLAAAVQQARDAKKNELLAGGASDAEAEAGAAAHAHRFRRTTIKQWAREAAARERDTAAAAGRVDFDIEHYDIHVFIFNGDIDYFGSPDGVVLGWIHPTNHRIDMRGVPHEVGHGLGLIAHSRAEDSAVEYGDPWDIMSAYSVMSDGSVPDSAFGIFGPGLNAVNMDQMGWLDHSRLFTGGYPTGYTFRLRPLHRTDLPGYLAAKLDFGGETIYVEYRAKERWDAHIERSCLLVHRASTHPGGADPCSELIVTSPGASGYGRYDLREDEVYTVGEPADPFAYTGSLRAARLDDDSLEATVSVSIRPRRQIEPHAIPFGGVTTDGGGLIWVPGRGFIRVPPRSPLLPVLELMAQYEAVRSAQGVQRDSRVVAFEFAKLAAMRDQLTAMVTAHDDPKVPGAPLRRR